MSFLKIQKLNSTEVPHKNKRIPGEVTQWAIRVPADLKDLLFEEAEQMGITAAHLGRKIWADHFGLDYEEYDND